MGLLLMFDQTPSGYSVQQKRWLDLPPRAAFPMNHANAAPR